MTTRAFDLASLLGRVPVETFVADYWQRDVLVVNRNDPAFYRDLLELDELDALLTETALPVSQVNLGKNAAGIPRESYSVGGYVDPASLIGFHKQGNTIILRAMHLWLPKLRALCQTTEDFFHCDAQANVYMTPASTQSSYPHWDAHDIFVLQIAGSKRWRLHSAPLAKPLRSYEFDPQRHPIGPQIGEFTLHAGDMAYVPRGVAHNPAADDYSVHIALGVLIRTWADVFATMFEKLTSSDVQLREALPVKLGEHEYDQDEAGRQLAELAAKFASPELLRETLRTLTERFLQTRTPSSRHRISQYARGQEITLATVLEVPPVPPPIVRDAGDRSRVVLNGIALDVTRDFSPALQFVASRRRLRVCDIPTETDAQRIALAYKLFDEGAVRVAVDP